MNNISFKQNNLQKAFLQESGFSLIELMVAVVIGLFITLGLSEVFLSMYSTSQSQNALAQFQDNQRLGIVLLSNTVEMAGYYSATPTSTTSNTAALVATTYKNPDGTVFAAGQGIVGTASSTSDTLNVYFQTSGTDNVINCLGNTATTNPTTYINNFSIVGSQLVCTVITNGKSPVSSPALVLANNVQSMKILYGVDVNNIGTVSAYLNASDVTTNLMWLNVRSVQITLNFCTANVMNPNTTASCSSTSTPTTPWVQTINLMAKS